MRKLRLIGAAILASATLLVVNAKAQNQGAVPASFFDMQMGKGSLLGEPWPVDSFSGIRLWDSGTAWALMNGAPGQYDWSLLDAWLADAKQHNVDVIYCFGSTPVWASSNPNDSSCSADRPGECDPPNDLNSDGTGTNQRFKDFVTAIATRVNDPTYLKTHAPITYWEPWNEAPNPRRWSGNITQMLRIAKDVHDIVKGINPNAVILSPSGGIKATENFWFGQYYGQGGGDYADVIAYHGYVQKQNVQPIPEDLYTSALPAFQAVLHKFGQDGKLLFDTEGSWGVASCCNFDDKDLQAGFTARFVLMHWLGQTARFYWYLWNDGTAGRLWEMGHTYRDKGTLLKPGIAYASIYNWMLGNTVVTPCTQSGANNLVWACNLTGPNGWIGQIVWDGNQTCSNGVCTTSDYSVNPQYVQYVTLYKSRAVKITGGSVKIGYLPILLENQNLPKSR